MGACVAILGASGAVGSTLASHILRAQLLQPEDTLVLVGHGIGGNAARLLATRIDLQDAFDEAHVKIALAPDIDEVQADIVVIAAGATISEQRSTRRDLGQANLDLFRHISAACAVRLPRALFIVVSNPIELAVKVIAESVDRRRVIGMGAQQDSLRFARAIATDLGISRHDVLASVVGEHGQAMVPLWQSVRLVEHAQQRADLLTSLEEMRRRAGEVSLPERVAALHAAVLPPIAAGHIDEAYQIARRALPDARIFIEPFVTVRCMHSTPNSTANAALQVIAAALAADRRLIYGQVRLEGEAEFGIEGVCGVPLTLDSNDGWAPASPTWLDADVRAAMLASAASIRAFLAQFESGKP